MNDLVSIITPTYNCGKFISETIQSVEAQTYKNWEMIIVDDCSTDNTREVVNGFAASDERIHYHCNDKNCGAAVTRNRALCEAKGRWIAFLDSDDLWLPEKLKKQISFMEKNGYAFSYHDYEEIDEHSQSMNVHVSGPCKVSKIGMFAFCWPGCLTVMYDSQKVGVVQISDIKKNNDYAMWLKVCRKAVCYKMPDMLAQYRRGRCGSISTHGYTTLIKWHYRLFREAEGMNPIMSSILTVGNLCFGLMKKILYVKK